MPTDGLLLPLMYLLNKNMNYCLNSNKTTITYTTIEGIKQQYIASQGNIDIQCSDSERTGKYIFTVQDGGYNTDCSPQHEITYYSNIFIADSYTISADTSPYPNLAQCTWVKLTFYIGDDISASQNFPSLYQVNQANNPNYSPGGKALVVKNSSGSEIFKDWVKDCNHVVTCDDDCPEGSHKCTHNKYPGYCCVPCQEVGSRLKNIASKVRG